MYSNPNELEFGHTYKGKILNRYTIYFKEDNEFINSYDDTIQFVKPKIIEILNKRITDDLGIKFSLIMTATFVKESFGEMIVDGVVVKMPQSKQVAYMRTKNYICINKDEIDNAVNECVGDIIIKIDEYTNQGSNWVFMQADKMDLEIAKYKPFKGGSYMKTPEYVPPRCVINVENDDDACFKWAILSSQFPPECHPERVSKYKPHEKKFNFDGIHYPADIKNVKKFEKQNPTLSVNVFLGYYKECKGVKTFQMHPLYVSDRYHGFEKSAMIDLLLIEGKHYVWIKNFGGLCYRFTKNNHKKYPCRRCLHVCSSPDVLSRHVVDCKGISKSPKKVKLPDETNNFIEFDEYKMCMKVPLIIYADLEAYNKNVDIQCGDNTRQIAEQDANSYCYTVVWRDGKREGPFLYRGPEPVEHFLNELRKLNFRVTDILSDIKPMIMTDEQKESHEIATRCYLCNCEFDAKNNKVAHHDHLNGLYEGPACNACNLQMVIKPKKTPIPVVFHNLRGYDSHLILSKIGKLMNDKTYMRCIPNNMEKYMSFNMNRFTFIDSYQFMSDSLDTLAKNLSESEMVHTRDYIKDKEIFDLLRKKGVYPYEWVSEYDHLDSKFNETQLPNKDAFYNRLTRTNISNEDYEHAKNVWEKCKCKNFGDYHDIYLETDVMLLTDVFETFRSMALKNYGLDPAYKFSTPGFAWSAMMKNTKMKLELITDYDMHLMYEKGIRGGISTVGAKRLAEANNKYCKNYDPEKPSTHIMYHDANALYGWAMTQKLPYGGFKWIDLTLEEAIDLIQNTTTDDNVERIYEVDLEYPEELHDDHSDYPLAPEKLKIKKDMYSIYQLELAEKIGNNLTEYEKLVPNLMNKEKYVIHGQLLKLYMELGLKLKRVYRVIQFNQSAWLEPFIRQNTDLRKKSKSEFEKCLYKLMNNAIYGKTMENVRERIRVELVHGSNETKIQKLVNSPCFDYARPFENDVIAFHMFKTTVKLYKPIYIGQAILDISKHLMYNFWYNHIKKNYGNKAQLLYTDTDSLLYEVETEDIYQDMKKNEKFYDFSEYPKDHFCYDPSKAKTPGLFKDESCGRPITAFAGIMSKMYSFTRDPLINEEEKIICDKTVFVKKGIDLESMSKKEQEGLSKDNARKNIIKKIKGVGNVVVNLDTSFEMYKNCIETGAQYSFKQTMIRSKKHKIGIYEQTKLALSPLDTKRYILDDGINTLAFGHYKIREANYQMIDDFFASL